MDVRDLPPAEFPSEDEPVSAAAPAPEPFEAAPSREPVMTADQPVPKGDGRLLPDLRHQVNADSIQRRSLTSTCCRRRASSTADWLRPSTRPSDRTATRSP
jgi:hypothetical protein